MANQVAIILLSILAAECCVSTAQNCATDIASAEALFHPLSTQIDALKEQLNVTKQLLTCSCNKDVPNCTEGPLGMEDGRVPDSSITASSILSTSYAPQKARLNTKGSSSCWIPLAADQKPWIQVDFQNKVYITGVITQGRGDTHHWVREYQVAFSQDGSTWTNVAAAGGGTITFPGNTDSNTEITNRLPAAVNARYLRIYPTAFHAYRAIRFEVIGCATA